MAKKKLIIIGGGAAGIFCAVHAAKLLPDWEVVVLEQSNQILAKVRISGGGRCNVTHDCSSISEMVKYYPRGGNFLKKSFGHFFTKDTIAWFAARGVTLKVEPDGRMFPTTDSSETIIDALTRELNRYQVQIRYQSKVVDVQKIAPTTSEQESIPRYRIRTRGQEDWVADAVCIACGGFPKMEMFSWVQALGHTIVPPLPSLFTFNMPHAPIRELMGISVPNALVKIEGTKLSETGPVLITHWGLSGPAILKLSAWGARTLAETDYQCRAIIQWSVEHGEAQVRPFLQTYRQTNGAQKIGTKNPFQLPQRLWTFLLETVDIDPGLRWADLPAKSQNQLIQQICQFRAEVKGKTTFKEEFVTAGGVSRSEVDPNTMESKVCPNLYLAGEILDVDGVTGGYNFQHAWTSGFIAATAMAARHAQVLK
jgi:predicted Rossmann fold flavoprotein